MYADFQAAKRRSEGASHLIRRSHRYPLCGRGDVNTYSVFAELNRTLIRHAGRVGCVVPSGIATDATTKHFFQDLVETRTLASLYDFENRKMLFPAIDSRIKFCLLTLVGPEDPAPAAEFAFFLLAPEELGDPERRFELTADDIALVNPNTRTTPIFRTRRDAELTEAVYKRVPILWREGDPDGNPWGLRFTTMFHMANDSHLFLSRTELEADGWELDGNVFRRDGERYLPLYEGKMVHQFDHRWATYEGPGARDVRDVGDDEKVDPQFAVIPRYWVPKHAVDDALAEWPNAWLLGWRDIARSTDERTMIASLLPRAGVGHKFLLAFPEDGKQSANSLVLLAVLNALILDYVCRQKFGGTSLAYFIVKQLPVPSPRSFEARAPWNRRSTVRDWMVPRVRELVATTYRMASALAPDNDGRPFAWNRNRRALIRAELDAALFHLYGLQRSDADYVLETFPIVRRKDEATYGEYRTKRLTLERYDALAGAIASGAKYHTPLDPPPGAEGAGRPLLDATVDG